MRFFMTTKALVLAIGLSLSLPLTAAANTCIGYYGVEAKINYQHTRWPPSL